MYHLDALPCTQQCSGCMRHSEQKTTPALSPPPLTSLSRCRSALCTVSNWTSGPSGPLSAASKGHLPSSSFDCNVDTRSKLLICCCCNASLSYFLKKEIYCRQVFQETGALKCGQSVRCPQIFLHTPASTTCDPQTQPCSWAETCLKGETRRESTTGGPRSHWEKLILSNYSTRHKNSLDC